MAAALRAKRVCYTGQGEGRRLEHRLFEGIHVAGAVCQLFEGRSGSA